MHVAMFPRPQTKALIAAMTVKPPSGARTRVIDMTYRGLVGLGLLPRLDIGYLFAAHAEQAARLNWKTPGTFTCTAVNSPTFTADQGFAGDGSTSYLDSNFNPSSAAGRVFARDSAHIGSWGLENISGSNTFSVGGSSAAQELFIVPRNGSDQLTGRVNAAANLTVASVTDSSGHTVLSRTASNLTTAYKAGVSVGTDATASAAVANQTLVFLKSSGFFTTRQLSAGHAGSGLSGAELAALHAILRSYMQGVGAV